jgi:hypothetical protein
MSAPCLRSIRSSQFAFGAWPHSGRSRIAGFSPATARRRHDGPRSTRVDPLLPVTTVSFGATSRANRSNRLSGSTGNASSTPSEDAAQKRSATNSYSVFMNASGDCRLG